MPSSCLFRAATVENPRTLFIIAGQAGVHWPIYRTILLVPTVLTQSILIIICVSCIKTTDTKNIDLCWRTRQDDQHQRSSSCLEQSSHLETLETGGFHTLHRQTAKIWCYTVVAIASCRSSPSHAAAASSLASLGLHDTAVSPVDVSLPLPWHPSWRLTGQGGTRCIAPPCPKLDATLDRSLMPRSSSTVRPSCPTARSSPLSPP
jgi:hypothetical protein